MQPTFRKPVGGTRPSKRPPNLRSCQRLDRREDDGDGAIADRKSIAARLLKDPERLARIEKITERVQAELRRLELAR